jgi:hypothetical protein
VPAAEGFPAGRDFAAWLGLTPLESSKVIDLEKFIPRGELDPVYFDRLYYLYPDGPIAVETLRVIGTATAETGVIEPCAGTRESVGEASVGERIGQPSSSLSSLPRPLTASAAQ